MFIYLVSFNADSTEGRGPMVPKEIFTTRKEAQKFADRNEPYGYPGQFNSVEEFSLWEKAEDVVTEEDLRKSALAKLTSDERKALNL